MERVQTLHPDPEKSGPRIPRFKYDAVRRAILASLPRDEPGLAFASLFEAVRERLDPEELARLGSLRWHTTTVKLDLEARGEIRRVAKARPQRIVRVLE